MQYFPLSCYGCTQSGNTWTGCAFLLLQRLPLCSNVFNTTTASILNVSVQNFLLLNVTIFNLSILLKWMERTYPRGFSTDCVCFICSLCLLGLIKKLIKINKKKQEIIILRVQLLQGMMKSSPLIWHSTAVTLSRTVWLQNNQNRYSRSRDVAFIPRPSSSFSKSGAYITHNAI